MNLFSDYQKKIANYLIQLKKDKLIDFPEDLKNFTVELPPKGNKADISCNVVMILTKFNNKTSLEIGDLLKKYFLEKFQEFEKIEVAKIGFLNITFTNNFWKDYLIKLIKSGPNYGSYQSIKKKYNIEFVSANPTGPLHVGHCRGAILGDTLSKLLRFNGHLVTKEYYVNDYGEQIKNFVYSVYLRILEIIENKVFPNNKDLYPGNYIIDIAKKIIKEKKIKNFKNYEKIYAELSKESLKFSMNLIIDDLNLLEINHDEFIYESEIIKNQLVSSTIQKLQKNNYVYEGKLEPPKGEVQKDWQVRKQLLFRSTKFGDDRDRSLQKSDKSWTYFASDIAYHGNKVNRNFDVLINVLGADHAGYIKRISAAVKAISDNRVNLICKVCQLVKLFKQGKPFKMSKRQGDYVTLNDLIKEVGKDSVRFMMLNRSNDVELDFDFDKVTEKSRDNPVFYVQYAYARINSIFRILDINIDNNITLQQEENFSFNFHETQILKKISEWPRCIELSINKLEPHRIVYYLYDLATIFHFYWNLGKENSNLKFINDNKAKNSSLLILKSLVIVLENGMKILGVSLPKRM